jgi:hypothetical protein
MVLKHCVDAIGLVVQELGSCGVVLHLLAGQVHVGGRWSAQHITSIAR